MDYKAPSSNLKKSIGSKSQTAATSSKHTPKCHFAKLEKNVNLKWVHQSTGLRMTLQRTCRLLGEKMALRSKALASYATSPDVKTDLTSLDTSVKELQAQLVALRPVLASMYGDKPVPFRIPLSVEFNATGTTGIATAPLVIDVSACPEWASLSALFDEYRFRGGKLHYWIPAPSTGMLAGGASGTSLNMATLGYDPADATPATSSRTVCELKQHKQLAPRVIYAGTAQAYVGVYGKESNEPFVFDFTTEGVTNNYTSAGASFVGDWKGTSSGPFQDGWIKPYYASSQAASAAVLITGILYLDIQLRSRT